MTKISWPCWWSLGNRIKQARALLVGLWTGRGLPEKARCPICGAPVYWYLDGEDIMHWQREYCTNKWCWNYSPF